MNIFKEIKNDITSIVNIAKNEFLTIATNYAIILVLMGGIVIYGLLYNYMYAPDLVKNAPVAVVNNSHSELSRRFIRYMDASPQIDIIATDIGYPEAQKMMNLKEVIGFVYIPSDFEDRVSRGEQSIFIIYETTSIFLYLQTIQESSYSCMLALNDYYRPEMIVFLDSPNAMELTNAKAINVEGTALYNHTEGYGSYLIPAVLFIIIFQTLVMVVAMVSGEEKHSGKILNYIASSTSLTFKRTAQIVFGKTITYLIIYALFCIFLLGFIPILFDLPRIGNVFYTIILFIPYIFATVFFSLSFSFAYSDGDAPLILIAFFSVGLIFLSGISYPLELQPWYWRCCHYVFPAATGTLAYVMLNSMGSSMSDIAVNYITLWIQTIIYFIIACFVLRHNIQKALKKNLVKTNNGNFSVL